jgi:hypothetical protein
MEALPKSRQYTHVDRKCACFTSVVESCADMNIRAMRLADVRNRGFEGVERSELAPKYESISGGVKENSRTVSISTTVLKPFSESPERGARKLPAAPIK